MCCLFSKGNRLQEKVATHWYCFSSFLIIQSTATGTQQQALLCCIVISSEAAKQVHPVHQVWLSPFSVRPFYKFIWFTKCHNIQSQTLQSPIKWCTVNLLCESYQCHDCWSSLYVATAAPFCGESPFISYHSVIMLPDLWLCNYATNLQPFC